MIKVINPVQGPIILQVNHPGHFFSLRYWNPVNCPIFFENILIFCAGISDASPDFVVAPNRLPDNIASGRAGPDDLKRIAVPSGDVHITLRALNSLPSPGERIILQCGNRLCRGLRPFYLRGGRRCSILNFLLGVLLFQMSRFLIRPLISGKKMGAFGLTEPNAGTDSAAQQTIAEKQEDGSYIINGSKVFITGAGCAETYIVFAMTDKKLGNKGISAFIMDINDPGFSIGKIEHKMGIRGSQTGELIFENVHLPADRLLGKENGGFKIAMTTLDGGRIGIASQALGIAQGALDQAIAYMKERVQFRKPLSSFQGLQWMVADMETNIEAARLLVRRAAFNKDHGLPYTKEAAMAKLFAAETAMDVTTKCVQIFGGYGYTREYPVERMMRDAKITEIYEGTSQVQRMVIAGQLLR